MAASATACGGTDQLQTDPADASLGRADALADAASAADSIDDASPMALGADGRADGGVLPGEGGSLPGCQDQQVPPSTLACTGLYADVATKTLAPGVHFYLPGVILWSDNAQKMRWIQLPPGSQIDASHPSEWSFPIGTKVWKEFSKDGKRVETRLFQKVDSGPPSYWVHATYAWNADETAAVASNGGDIPFGPDGGTYHIPTFAECDKCHNGRADHILGFEEVALGLAGAQGLTLPELVNEGLITPAPARTQLTIGDDGTDAAAPALGWLHINCGVTCHNGNSTSTAYGVGMRLRLDPALLDGRALAVSDLDSLETTLGVPAASPGWIQPTHWTRIVPGDPSHSLVVQLISNRGTNNLVGGQMPPIATSLVDTDDVAKVVAWIAKMPGALAIDAGPEGGPDATVASPDAGADATNGAGGD